MRLSIPFCLAIAVGLVFLSAMTMGCAQSKSWRGGDACSEIGKIHQRLQEIDAEEKRLGGKTPASTEESTSLSRLLERLQEEKRDLQSKSESLQSQCDPQDTRELDAAQRRKAP